MMELQDLVDGSRAFINDCHEETRVQLQRVPNELSKDLFDCIEQLMFAVNMTTDSLVLLVELKRVWDATILLRSLLDGSARICYLLSSSTKEKEKARLHEFRKLLPKAEMGGLEQPVSGMINSPFYGGSNGGQDPILDPIKLLVDQMKPLAGEGKKLREVKARWNFFYLSNKLCEEDANLTWKDFAPIFGYRYAMSNQLVHKTDTGCGQILERSRREPLYRSISDLAHSSSVLVSACFLTYVRVVTLLKREKADSWALGSVLMKYEDFFNGTQEIEDAFVLAYKRSEEQNKSDEKR